MPGRLYYWIADWNLSRAHAALLLASKGPVADMVDCTHTALPRVLHTSIRRFGGYITGSGGIAWTLQDFKSLPAGSRALSIDQSDADRPLHGDVMVCKDVEPGAAVPHLAVQVARERINAGEDYSIYCDRSELVAVEAQVSRAGLHPGEIVAFQYASPSSNPHTLLPGTNLTLQQANADLSVVLASWLPLPEAPKPPPPPPPPPAVKHAVWRAELEIAISGPRRGQWHIKPLPGRVE